MKTVVLLVVFAAACSGAEWDAFKVTYGKNGQGYYDMPWTVAEASEGDKWVKVEEDKQTNTYVFAQPQDPRVMLLFDKKENIAGIRMSFLKEDVEKKAKEGGYSFDFDYDKNPMYTKAKYFDQDLWYASALFASPRTLAAGGRKPLNKATDNAADGVFFKAEDGNYVEISKDECKPTVGFQEAKCFDGMGKHYFYKLDEIDCKQRKAVFGLYDEGRLIGFGMSGFGPFSKHPKTQSYFEDFPAMGATIITPNAPKCIEEYISKYGKTAMHVYFKKNASSHTCPTEDWKNKNC